MPKHIGVSSAIPALKELQVIVGVKEPHRRRAMFQEWIDTWVDELSAVDHHAAEEGEVTPELRTQRYADLGTQLAHGLLSTGEERGSVSFTHAKDHAVVTLLVLRPRRKTKKELFG